MTTHGLGLIGHYFVPARDNPSATPCRTLLYDERQAWPKPIPFFVPSLCSDIHGCSSAVRILDYQSGTSYCCNRHFAAFQAFPVTQPLTSAILSSDFRTSCSAVTSSLQATFELLPARNSQDVQSGRPVRQQVGFGRLCSAATEYLFSNYRFTQCMF
jgi:hypothetical protein